MTQTTVSTRTGLFAALLSVMALSLFGGLIAADRALSRADRQSVDRDASLVAVVAERELRMRAADLSELFDPLLPGAGRAVSSLPPGFDATWIVDGGGRLVWRRDDGAPSPADSTILRAADIGDGGLWLRMSPRGILVAVALFHRGQRLGTAVGLVATARLLAALSDPDVPRQWVAIAGDSTLGSTGARDAGSLLVGRARIQLPGDPLTVEVAHALGGRTLRTVFWMLGVVALVALLISLARERAQALQRAARTAELERLYEEVERSNRMKSEFLANVSHELRTPLNAIVGFVEMLREGVYGDLSPRQALPVDRVAASATHLRHLVDRLLDIAKIAAGRLELNPEPLVLRPFVLNVASEMESLVSERGLALSIGVGPSLPRIRTDQTHLRQILINLIGNAVKYTPSGSIHVRAEVVGGHNGVAAPPSDAGQAPHLRSGPPPDPRRSWVALQVTDTGVGIALADQERIFDEFEQVNAGARTDSARRGTGLGLAISRRLARLLGGELSVASEPGRGSAFTVWLPLDAQDAPPA